MKSIRNELAMIYHSIERYYYQCLTLLSPRLNTKARYRQFFHRKINLDNPISFNEKLLKLKLENYIYNPLVKKCADKYAVRKYIEEKGCSDILVPLIANYDRVEDIEWDKLPESFVMKWNFGCGFNVICSKKSQLDIDKTIKKMKKWGRDKSCYLDYSEMQYKDVKRQIIIEQHLTHGVGGGASSRLQSVLFSWRAIGNFIYQRSWYRSQRCCVFYAPMGIPF